jgi:hypothetical protein
MNSVMKDNYDLNDVPDEGRAALAASYLTGPAKTTYGAYKAAAVIEGKKFNCDFFVATLRTAYVPRAQVADDLQKYSVSSCSPPLRPADRLPAPS